MEGTAWYTLPKMFHTDTLHFEGKPLQTQWRKFLWNWLALLSQSTLSEEPNCVDSLCYNCYLRLHLSILFHQNKLFECLDLVQTVVVIHVMVRLKFAGPCRPAERAIIHVQYNMQHWRRWARVRTLCAMFGVFVLSLGLHCSPSAILKSWRRYCIYYYHPTFT